MSLGYIHCMITVITQLLTASSEGEGEMRSSELYDDELDKLCSLPIPEELTRRCWVVLELHS